MLGEVFRHRIYIKDNEIVQILNRDDFPDSNEINGVASGGLDGEIWDSYVDKEYTADIRPPMWIVDSGTVRDMTMEEYETFRQENDPSLP
mgnify:CR=1 FL=1|tara:strand:+ start:973 stop:1242 length:270 start_codon:yes stop_codon:yes gene_type:complete